MAKAHLKFMGFKVESQNLSAGAALAFVVFGMFAVIPALLWLTFWMAHWAIFTLFAYDITVWQFLATLILSSMLKSLIYKD